MEKKQSEFNKVFSAWDILVIAFGAMIGWGWVVSSGGWIQKGGVLGAALGFVVGGVMIFFVGLTYAELTAAMPQCGGEHVWSHRAMGPTGSFVCTWAIVLGYVGVACFEASVQTTLITEHFVYLYFGLHLSARVFLNHFFLIINIFRTNPDDHFLSCVSFF